jgi:acyltransferase
MNQRDLGRRNAVIDNARGVAILLVILGHAPGLPPALSKWIFSFHVPLFFLISGMSAQASMLSLMFYIKKLSNNLLVPFLCFWLFSYAYWLPTHRLGGNPALYADYSFATPWIGLLIATGDRLPMNPALWFFTALFLVAILFRGLLEIQNEIFRLVAAFLISLAAITISILDKQSYIWNFDIALSCLFFYSLGAAFRPAIDRLNELRVDAFYLGPMIFALVVSTMFFSFGNFSIDINNRVYGLNAWVFLFNALLGSLAIIFLAKFIPSNPTLFFMSRNALPLFAVHMVAFRVLTAILIVGFGLTREEIKGIIFLVIYFFWAILFTMPIIYLGQKYVPFALGIRRPAPSIFDLEDKALISARNEKGT